MAQPACHGEQGRKNLTSGGPKIGLTAASRKNLPSGDPKIGLTATEGEHLTSGGPKIGLTANRPGCDVEFALIVGRIVRANEAANGARCIAVRANRFQLLIVLGFLVLGFSTSSAQGCSFQNAVVDSEKHPDIVFYAAINKARLR